MGFAGASSSPATSLKFGGYCLHCSMVKLRSISCIKSNVSCHLIPIQTLQFLIPLPSWEYGFRKHDWANRESDNATSKSTKPVKHWIINISRNIGVVFFKLGTRNVHHKTNKMTPIVAMTTLLSQVYFCQKLSSLECWK